MDLNRHFAIACLVMLTLGACAHRPTPMVPATASVQQDTPVMATVAEMNADKLFVQMCENLRPLQNFALKIGPRILDHLTTDENGCASYQGRIGKSTARVINAEFEDKTIVWIPIANNHDIGHGRTRHVAQAQQPEEPSVESVTETARNHARCAANGLSELYGAEARYIISYKRGLSAELDRISYNDYALLSRKIKSHPTYREGLANGASNGTEEGRRSGQWMAQRAATDRASEEVFKRLKAAQNSGGQPDLEFRPVEYSFAGSSINAATSIEDRLASDNSNHELTNVIQQRAVSGDTNYSIMNNLNSQKIMVSQEQELLRVPDMITGDWAFERLTQGRLERCADSSIVEYYGRLPASREWNYKAAFNEEFGSKFEGKYREFALRESDVSFFELGRSHARSGIESYAYEQGRVDGMTPHYVPASIQSFNAHFPDAYRTGFAEALKKAQSGPQLDIHRFGVNFIPNTEGVGIGEPLSVELEGFSNAGTLVGTFVTEFTVSGKNFGEDQISVYQKGKFEGSIPPLSTMQPLTRKFFDITADGAGFLENSRASGCMGSFDEDQIISVRLQITERGSQKDPLVDTRNYTMTVERTLTHLPKMSVQERDAVIARLKDHLVKNIKACLAEAENTINAGMGMNHYNSHYRVFQNPLYRVTDFANKDSNKDAKSILRTMKPQLIEALGAKPGIFGNRRVKAMRKRLEAKINELD